MDVKEAVQVAKAYVAELFDDENIRNVGLEEVDRSEDGNTWTITIDFSRPWESYNGPLASVMQSQSRSYKQVHIRDKYKRVFSITSKTGT